MSYKTKAVIADALPHNAAEYPPMPCRQCADMTPRAMLGAYGALCFQCYSSYCRRGPAPRPYQPESPTVRDMKTRMRHGHRFDAMEKKAA